MAEPMLSVYNINVWYGAIHAIKDISFNVNEGEIVALIGANGAGKSTTLACIIDKMNKARTGHIITMEDPIEYVHRHEGCIVTQREIPSDVATYAEALRSAMREAPDVILLG